jgi:L-arabinonolactonase
MLRIEVACADRDQLGEGPLWDVDEQRLYWIDSYGPAIHRMEPNGAKKTWPVPEPIGSLVLRRSGGGILALRRGFFAFDFSTGEAKRICESQPGELRPVSTTARPIGRVGSSPGQWISKNGAPVGKLFRLDPDTFRFIHWMGKSSAPMDRAGARTDAPSTSPTQVAARSTLTTTIR